jgi:hypothetical protein
MKSDGGLCGITLGSHPLFMGVEPIIMSLVADIIERR